ncbi:DNA translocase FtsK [Bartonella raoultii]|uniref:DNA translocase FtsK n=1 Tax=Bartonella raoultii TaxID=1457020 RepID=UPI0035A27569
MFSSSADDFSSQVVVIVLRDRKAFTFYLQRRLGIGYSRAVSLVARMEREGIMSAANDIGRRKILVPAQEEHF